MKTNDSSDPYASYLQKVEKIISVFFEFLITLILGAMVIGTVLHFIGDKQ